VQDLNELKKEILLHFPKMGALVARAPVDQHVLRPTFFLSSVESRSDIAMDLCHREKEACVLKNLFYIGHRI
jgi:hypothetical protein